MSPAPELSEREQPASEGRIATGQRGFAVRVGGAAWRLALVAILFLTFFPFMFLVMTSLKNTYQFYHQFWTPAWPPAWENYTRAFLDLKAYIFNSILVTAISISGIIGCSTVTGFLFARYRFPGREFLYHMMLVMLMAPGALMLIPQFVWVQQLGLLNTLAVMILPYIAGMQVMGMFLLRSFFGQIDQALFESAQVDGAGVFRQMWHIAAPLSKPVIGVVAIMSALGVWNSFLWPLVTVSGDDIMVLTVGMLRYNGRVANQYGPMFAGYVISAIPLGILFIFFTRTFMRGITSGALKA